MNTQQTKHTPGPWRLLPGQDLLEIVQPSNGSGHYLIADCSGSPLESEREANARLIASAPALLEALQSLNEWLVEATEQELNHQTLDQALAWAKHVSSSAIAAATESEVSK